MNRFHVGLGLPTVSVNYALLEVWTDYPVFIQFIWKKDVSTNINVFFFMIWKKMWKHMRPFTFTIVYRNTVHLLSTEQAWQQFVGPGGRSLWLHRHRCFKTSKWPSTTAMWIQTIFQLLWISFCWVVLHYEWINVVFVKVLSLFNFSLNLTTYLSTIQIPKFIPVNFWFPTRQTYLAPTDLLIFWTFSKRQTY